MNYADELEKKLSKGVYAKYYCEENGECKYFSECKKKLRNKVPKYKCDRVRIGTNYGQPGIPKILCVGLEGICGQDILNEEKIVKGYLKPSKAACNAHYNGVIYVLEYILSAFIDESKKPVSLISNNNSDRNKVTDKYALTNFYRCAFAPKDNPSLVKNLSHSKGMREHCQEILIDEIKTLKPDILIVQSSQWPENLWNIMKEEFGFNKAEIGFGNHDQTSVFKGKINEMLLVLVCTYHGAYAKFKSKEYIENKLNPVLDKAIEFVKNQNAVKNS